MTYENELPLPDYDGGPADRARDKAKELMILRHAQEQGRLAELTNIIAAAIRPWIGDDAESSVGITKINDEMARRAAANAVKQLQKEGKI